MRKIGIAVVAVAAAAQLTCHQALLVAPPGSSIVLIPNPPFIPAHGGVSVITAIVTEPAGTPVADGTNVQFFTTLGRIDERGKTNDGVARVNLVADGRSGRANVTAVSGGPAAPAPAPTGSPAPPPGGGGSGGTGSATTAVDIGSALPKRMLLAADPSRITVSRSTHVVATVFDDNGNPVANAPVIFTVTDNPATEFMDSQGRPIFTNNNGQAEDVMRTRRSSSGTARVKATTPGSGAFIEATVDIPIVF